MSDEESEAEMDELYRKIYALRHWGWMQEPSETDKEQRERDIAILQIRHKQSIRAQPGDLYRRPMTKQTDLNAVLRNKINHVYGRFTPDVERVLKRPKRGSSRLVWFRFKENADELGIKFTHKELAAELGLAPGTVRHLFSKYKKEQAKRVTK